ncbi:hypothetical protein BEWA_040140 [Theileria equi strain WA]|uniref:Uncharacterized protein n=1 Tax=Theileria equi strain WA TaxID=1537102 RepID=L1LF44_THEEQ|nr:hypothetical protein BEWA_040140 [Theileria equi strain WA]EKX73976.1 hypothetical protein BEWA_040140 [Theileria equi strain WA]|eukprot:XP_004833428.1 hypothetical protein BEWA_040140 [Theileria equi strain WA]
MTTDSGCTVSAYSSYLYVLVDIFNKNEYSHSSCGYKITPKEERNTPAGFKTYIHPLPDWGFYELFYYLGKIDYQGTEQDGFERIKYCHTDVLVYYWDYDEDNFCPLLVRVTKTGWSMYHYYEYYTPTGINTNNWKRYSGIANDISDRLKSISKGDVFGRVVVLKLDAKNNETYGVNGEETSDINKSVRIQVTGPKNEPSTDYRKYTHCLVSNGKMRVLGTKHDKIYKPFKESILKKEYTEASVYYSSKDSKYQKPLILQLGTGKDFYKLDGEKWVKDPSITSSGLKDALDKENDTHIINISKESKYQCSSPSCDKNIEVDTDQSAEKSHNYTKRRHYLQGNGQFSVSSFIGSDSTIQIGLSSPSGIAEVNIFWYPKQSGTPLLICYSSESTLSWFKKTKVDNEWKEVNDTKIKPTSIDDHAGIQKLLIEAESPEVSIQLDQVSGSGYSSDGDATINIRGEKVNDANGYSKITHEITGKTFIIKGIQHRGQSQTVKGTTTAFSKDSLTETSVFYSGSDPKISKPLLLELKLQVESKYIYYEKTKNANEWSLFESKQTTQYTGDPLKKKLDALYAVSIFCKN